MATLPYTPDRPRPQVMPALQPPQGSTGSMTTQPRPVQYPSPVQQVQGDKPIGQAQPAVQPPTQPLEQPAGVPGNPPRQVAMPTPVQTQVQPPAVQQQQGTPQSPYVMDTSGQQIAYSPQDRMTMLAYKAGMLPNFTAQEYKGMPIGIDYNFAFGGLPWEYMGSSGQPMQVGANQGQVLPGWNNTTAQGWVDQMVKQYQLDPNSVNLEYARSLMPKAGPGGTPLPAGYETANGQPYYSGNTPGTAGQPSTLGGVLQNAMQQMGGGAMGAPGGGAMGAGSAYGNPSSGAFSGTNPGGPVPLNQLGGYIEQMLGNPSAFNAPEVMKAREAMRQQIEDYGRGAAQDIESDAAKRGLTFSTVPNTSLGDLRERLYRAQNQADTGLLKEMAQTYGQDRGNAAQLAMLFGQNAFNNQMAQYGRQDQLAQNMMQYGMYGTPTVSGSLQGFMGLMNGNGDNGIDPLVLQILGQLYG